jgi:hypothetical protein
MLCHASAGHVAKGWPPAQLVVAGVLAAYAAQLRAAADFSPAWPQAFPEHLRTGSGRMAASKACDSQEFVTHACQAGMPAGQRCTHRKHPERRHAGCCSAPMQVPSRA